MNKKDQIITAVNQIVSNMRTYADVFSVSAALPPDNTKERLKKAKMKPGKPTLVKQGKIFHSILQKKYKKMADWSTAEIKKENGVWTAESKVDEKGVHDFAITLVGWSDDKWNGERALSFKWQTKEGSISKKSGSYRIPGSDW